MSKTDHDGQDSRPQDVDGLLNSIAGPENLNAPGQHLAERGMTTQLPTSSDVLKLGSQTPLIELFPMAAYAVRAPDGVIAWFNSRAAKLWGRVPALNDTDERFCGAYKLYHADGTHMAHCDTPVALALETGTSVHEQEVIIEKPDGSRVTVSVHIDPIRAEDGAIIGVVNFFQDIHERKQAERTTRLLAAIVDSSDDAIISKNLDGIITSWNKAAERIFGYTAQDAVGRNITMIIPPDRQQEEREILARLRRGERIDHFETIRKRKDGELLNISVTISPIEDSGGRVIGASKVARDITRQKRAEQALRESEERFRAIVETTPECVMLVAADGTLLQMNSSGLKMLGADSVEAIVGKNVYDLVAPKDRDWFREFNESICRGEKGSLEFDIVGLRGERHHFETHAAPLRNTDGTIVQLAVARDATNRKQVEAAIKERELSARLLQLQDQERRRIARELHDGVGQLLALLSINASRLNREKSKLSPDAARCADENSSLIEQVSADIRTISYLFHPPLLDEMGLHSALKWYIDGLAERSKITARLELPDDWERLPQDYELCLFRIAQECLINIHRHSGSSTALVRLLRSPGEIKLEVSDEGKGLDPEMQSKIDSGETAGVGLRGMRERVRQLGGSLEIRSNGKGTIVIATVPFAESQSTAASSSPDDEHEPHNRPLEKTNAPSSPTGASSGPKASSRAADA